MIMQAGAFSNVQGKQGKLGRIEEPEGVFQHFITAPAKSPGRLSKIASDREMIEYREDGYIRDLNFKSDQEFTGYCSARLEFFLENLPKMIGFMLGGMESSRKERLLQRATEIASKIKTNGLRIVLQSEGPVAYDNNKIYLKPWFGSSDASNGMTLLGLDGILLHEFFHAVQCATTENQAVPLSFIESTAELFVSEMIGRIFVAVPRFDGPTSYRLFFPYYLANRATDGEIIGLVLDFDWNKLKAVGQAAAAKLEVPERLFYIGWGDYGVSPLDGRLGALIAESMPLQKRQDYLAAFEAECRGAKASIYTLPQDFIKGFDNEIKLMVQEAGQEKNAIFAQCAVAMFFNITSPYLLDPPHNINPNNPEFAFPISLFYAQKILGKSGNEHSKKVAGMLDEILGIIDLDRFKWSNASKMNLGLVDIEKVEESLTVGGQISPSIKDAYSSGISASFVVPDLITTDAGNGREKVAVSFGFLISPVRLDKWKTGSRVLSHSETLQSAVRGMDFHLFPNPAHSLDEIALRLRPPATADTAVVKIYDVLGREIQKHDFRLGAGENILNLRSGNSALTSGAYFCQLRLFDAFGNEIDAGGVGGRTGKIIIAK